LLSIFDTVQSLYDGKQLPVIKWVTDDEDMQEEVEELFELGDLKLPLQFVD
jgi:hypothetical protein